MIDNNNLYIVINVETKEFFVSPIHDDYELKNFVPVSHYYPLIIYSLKNNKLNHVLNTANDVIEFYYPKSEGYKDITESDFIMDILTRPE